MGVDGVVPLPMVPGCGLDEAGLAEQRARARALAGAVRATRRTPDRLEVRFAPGVEAAVEELVAVERGCCPFLSLEWAPDARTLSIAAPPERRDVLDLLAAELAS